MLLNHAGHKVVCGKPTTGENLQCDDCIAYRAPIGPRPKLRPRCEHKKTWPGFDGKRWIVTCQRCKKVMDAHLPDEDAKIVTADPLLESLYGDIAV